MPAKHKKIKLQLAGQQTLPFVSKTTKDVDNENLGNTNTESDTQVLQSSESTGTDTPTSEKQSDTSLSSHKTETQQRKIQDRCLFIQAFFITSQTKTSKLRRYIVHVVG
jgi:hypothetical protein